MNRDGATPVSWSAGLLGGLLLASSPAVATAQMAEPTPPAPYATAVLYEVEENINCNPPRPEPLCLDETRRGFGTRIADAVLKGGLDGFPGGVSGPPEFSGPILVDAKSIISQIDWTGPAHGGIQVHTAGGIAHASFAGQLDLSMLVKAGVPLAPISGKWHGLKGLRVGGAFTGVFEIPFECRLNPACPTDQGACYLENGQCVVAEIPLVKLLVTFYSK